MQTKLEQHKGKVVVSNRKLTPPPTSFEETYPKYPWAPLVRLGLQLAKLWVQRRSAGSQKDAPFLPTRKRQTGSQPDPLR